MWWKDCMDSKVFSKPLFKNLEIYERLDTHVSWYWHCAALLQSKEELLEYDLKAVNLLTTSEENKLKTQVKELTKKNNEKEFVLNVAMMQKDKEVEDLRKQDKIKEEALIRLSDQVMLLMKDIQRIKTGL